MEFLQTPEHQSSNDLFLPFIMTLYSPAIIQPSISVTMFSTRPI